MLHRSRGHRDDGLTLIEVLIAVVVLSIISLAALEGVTALAGTTQDHRDVANVDGALSAYAEAVKQHVNFQTSLSGTCPAAGAGLSAGKYSSSTTTICVKDSSELTLTPVEVVVGGELIKVTNATTGGVLSVVRGDRGTAAAVHPTGATVNALYTPCPPAAELAPITSYPSSNYAYITSIGISSVEYWNATTNTFVDHATCETNFAVSTGLCPTYNKDTGTNWSATFQGSNLPICDSGLERVTVTAQTPSTSSQSTGAAAHSVSSSTIVLVRRGGGG